MAEEMERNIKTNERNSLTYGGDTLHYDGILKVIPQRIWEKVVTALGDVEEQSATETEEQIQKQAEEIERLRAQLKKAEEETPLLMINQRADINRLQEELSKCNKTLDEKTKEIANLEKKLAEQPKKRLITQPTKELDERFTKNMGNISPAKKAKEEQTILYYKAIMKKIFSTKHGTAKPSAIIGKTVKFPKESVRYSNGGKTTVKVDVQKTVSKSAYYRAMAWYYRNKSDMTEDTDNQIQQGGEDNG